MTVKCIQYKLHELILTAINVMQRLISIKVLPYSKWQQLENNCGDLFNFAIKNIDKKPDYDAPLAQGIVFSKDRPLQLEALLRSYFTRASNPVPLTVLYHCSNPKFKKAYNNLIREYHNQAVTFILENSFRNDVINLLQRISSPKVFFLVDDLIFIDAIDMDDYTSHDTNDFVPAMRLGLNLKYVYTRGNIYQPLPYFESYKKELQNEKICWKWSDGIYNFAYPLSLDGNLFSTVEVIVMFEILKFNSPNTLESALQFFNFHYKKRKGICYRRSKILNIPMNIVQTDIKNISENGDINELLNKWNQGLRIDIESLYRIENKSPHQAVKINFFLCQD